MGADKYSRFHFSVTCMTEDAAVLHCLRGLAHWAEDVPPQQIAWGGTKTSEWLAAGHNVTFRFTTAANRRRFTNKATELLSGGWTEVSTSDSDPAERQRPPH